MRTAAKRPRRRAQEPGEKKRLAAPRSHEERPAAWEVLSGSGQTLAMAEEQLADLRQRGDLKGESHLLVQIAYLHQELGDHAEASRIFQKAQVLKQSLADVEGEVMALGGWIETLDVLGDDTATCKALRRFVQLLETAGDPRVEALARTRLAATCARLDDPEAVGSS